MPVNIIRDPPETFALDIDAARTVTDLLEAVVPHWTRSLLGGRRAKGGALPPNSKGQPLGQGNGSIATTWVTSQVRGNAHHAEATSAPGQQGGLFYAVRSMVDADANPASIEGDVSAIIDGVVSRAADRAVR